jgi:hypothetical protein
MGVPRIGRRDLLHAPPGWPGTEPHITPARDLDDVAAQARAIADTLRPLQDLAGFIGRRSRGRRERLTRLQALREQAWRLWLELGELADEATMAPREAGEGPLDAVS